jgi:hypothetical protein
VSGAAIVQSLRRVTRLPLETHLMITDPDFFVDEFTEAGSDSFLVHCEALSRILAWPHSDGAVFCDHFWSGRRGSRRTEERRKFALRQAPEWL